MELELESREIVIFDVRESPSADKERKERGRRQ